MTSITRGWTAERRAKQAENCRKTKPWKHSTGPKTISGKNITKNNAIKHGLRSDVGKIFFRLLRIQKKFIKNLSKIRKTGYSRENIKNCLEQLQNNGHYPMLT